VAPLVAPAFHAQPPGRSDFDDGFDDDGGGELPAGGGGGGGGGVSEHTPQAAAMALVPEVAPAPAARRDSRTSSQGGAGDEAGGLF
jgi:hypothetical protein